MNLMQLLRNCTLLNFILLTASLIFTFGFLFPQLDADITFMPSKVSPKPSDKNQDEPSKPKNLSPQDYVIIADQNLFHPERKIPIDKKLETVLPKPEFVLYGTLITSDLSVAYLEDKKDPVTTPGRGQRQTALKKGDSMSGFRLKEIMADRVVMIRGEETIQVALEDPKSPKTRGTAAAPKPQPPGVPGTKRVEPIQQPIPQEQKIPPPPPELPPFPGPEFKPTRPISPGRIMPTRP